MQHRYLFIVVVLFLTGAFMLGVSDQVAADLGPWAEAECHGPDLAITFGGGEGHWFANWGEDVDMDVMSDSPHHISGPGSGHAYVQLWSIEHGYNEIPLGHFSCGGGGGGGGGPPLGRG